MKTVFLSLLLFLFAYIHPLFSQAGTLDVTFDTDGKVTTAVQPMGIEAILALAIQPDQKILAAGSTLKVTLDQRFALVRYHPDGSLDAGFGVDGKSITNFSIHADAGTCMVLQPDGKIIVAGYAVSNVYRNFALARYLENGSLDSSFANNGQQTTAVGPGNSEGWSVALQADGKIVVAGTAYPEPDRGVFALARYDPQGMLDTTFGIGGRMTTAIDSLNDHALAMAIRPDGKIVTVGLTHHGTDFDFAVVQYLPNGFLDTSFGTDGFQRTDINGFDDYGQSMALQPDGKIVVGGYTTAGNTMESFAIVRYQANGLLDTGFGLGGKTITPIHGVRDRIQAVALQTDGKIVAAGYSFEPIFNVYRFALVRYHPDGSLDEVFGKVTTAFQVGADQAYAVAIQADGKIVAGGGSTNQDFALARYLPGTVVGVGDTPFSSRSLLIYPNPATEKITLEYSLPSAEPVSIGLYDYWGKAIRIFANQEWQPAGKHTSSLLLPPGLPSGNYVIVLTTPSRRTSWQMVK